MPTILDNAVTIADLLAALGGIRPDRLRLQPALGTATQADVIEIHNRTDWIYELVDGILVQKPFSFIDSGFAAWIGYLIGPFVRIPNLGIVTGAAGAFELRPGLVQIPDIAFTSWGRMPGRRVPVDPILHLAPDLVVEVVNHHDNTAAEMARKRHEYLNAGVRLIWEFDIDDRVVSVHSVTQANVLAVGDTLDGGTVLPGFSVPVADIFAELDRHG